MRKLSLVLVVVLLALATPATSQTAIRLASTTSTDNSGLFGHLLPKFQATTGIRVDVIAVGTGQAIRLAQNGDADVLLVHHRPSEEQFVAEGYGVSRQNVMYNDFVVLGPAGDPAGIAGADDVATALARIAVAGAVFVSRGDDSGTHKKERELWQTAGVDVDAASGTWYRETGSGMGATLNTAAAQNAYTLSDRATWLSFQNKQDLAILSEGDPRLFNQYGVILVSPERHPHVEARAGRAFIDWIVSPAGQSAIADFRVGGQQLFFPNASAD